MRQNYWFAPKGNPENIIKSVITSETISFEEVHSERIRLPLRYDLCHVF